MSDQRPENWLELDPLAIQRAVKQKVIEGQIAVLEEVASAAIGCVMPEDSSRYIFSSVTKVVLLNKIAALRKELGE